MFNRSSITSHFLRRVASRLAGVGAKSLATSLFLLLTACEKSIPLDLPAGPERLVVEGHIEPGLPPVVLLTRSQAVFAPLDAATLAAALVHRARITVSTRDSVFTLTEVAADSLPLAVRRLLATQTGLTLTPGDERFPVPLTFYTSLPAPGRPALTGRQGRTYALRIEGPEGQLLTANTSLPYLTPVDSVFTKLPADPALADSLRVLWYAYRDPDTVGNAVRYFTKVNSEPFYPARFQTTFTDEFVNGRAISFPLERGRPRFQPYDVARSGLVRRGDTVTLRWCAIDQPHFRFWLSVDNALATNGSPLASPAALPTNIRGGLGIWGGYGATYTTLIVR